MMLFEIVANPLAPLTIIVPFTMLLVTVGEVPLTEMPAPPTPVMTLLEISGVPCVCGELESMELIVFELIFGDPPEFRVIVPI